MSYTYSVEERFLRYVQIDTTADPNATCFPSSEKQKDLARILVEELLQIGIEDAEMDVVGLQQMLGIETSQSPLKPAVEQLVQNLDSRLGV